MTSSNPKRPDVIALIASFVVAALFSVHYLVSKALLYEGADPIALSAFRGMFGGAILILIFREKVLTSLTKQSAPRIALVAFFGFFLNQLFFMEGLRRTAPVNAALLATTTPVVTAVLAIASRLEPWNMKRMAAILLGALAAAFYLLITQRSFSTDAVGNLLIGINIIIFSVSLLLLKRLLHDMPSEAVTGPVLFLAGSFLALIASAKLGPTFAIFVRTPQLTGLALFTILGSTALVYALNYFALRRLPLTTVSMFTFFQPILTAGLDFAVSGTVPHITLLPTVIILALATRWVIRN